MSVYALRIVGRPPQSKGGAELIVAANEEELASVLLHYAHGRDFSLITSDRARVATTLNAAGWDMPEIGQLSRAQHFLCAPLSKIPHSGPAHY